MKVFDSFKTTVAYHNIYKNLNSAQAVQFEKDVYNLFEKKQISDDGEYNTFKITEKDLEEIKSQLV